MFVSMKRGAIRLLILILKGRPCVEASLCSPHTPSGFDGRTEPEAGMVPVFPRSVLAATALVGDRAGSETRVRVRCKPGFLLGSVAVEDLSAEGLGPKKLEQEPWRSWAFPARDGSLCLGWGCDVAAPRDWAALLSWFHFSLVCRPWPEAGSGPVGLEGTEPVLLLPTCTQAMVVSVLARGRTGVKVAPGPPSACTVAALQSLSCVLTLCNSVTAAHQAFLSSATSRNLLKLTSHPLSWWCHPTISSSVVPFSRPPSCPASRSFKMSWLFTSAD